MVDRESGLPSSDDFIRLEGEVFERISTRHRRQVLRHRLVAVAAVIVIAGAGVAAGTIANPTQQSKFAYCYQGSTTNSRVAQLGFPTNRGYATRPGSSVNPEQVANALFLCEGAWQNGIFDSTGDTGPFPVPRLQVCLRDDLIVSVFRKSNAAESAETFCNNLGLSAP
jgi:hypothetical protein